MMDLRIVLNVLNDEGAPIEDFEYCPETLSRMTEMDQRTMTRKSCIILTVTVSCADFSFKTSERFSWSVNLPETSKERR